MTQLSPEARALLDRGRDALTPSAATKERVRESLNASLAGGAGAIGTSAAGASKLWLVLVLMAGIGAGVLLIRQTDGTRQVELGAETVVENVVPAAEPEPAVPAPEPQTLLVGPVLTPEMPTAGSEPARPEAKSSIPRTKKNAKKNAKRNAKRNATILHDLRAERTLIANAQRAIRDKDYAEARKLLGEHEARFPRGALRPERQAAQAMANCLDENGKSGKAIARRFLAAHPGSPLAPRVRKSCELGDL